MPAAEAVVVVVSLLAAALYGVAAVQARRERRALPALRPRPLTRDVVVVIPTRNEERRLGPTLDALLRDPSPRLRLVVVDDRSDDGTVDVVGARAHDPRLSLLRLHDEPPAGVFGKPRALAAAVAALDVDVDTVVVIDADVVVADGFVGGFVAAFDDARADGVVAASALPALDNHGPAEEALVPAFVAAVGVAFPPSSINNNETAFLNGQLMVLDRRRLDEVGGFDAVSHTVLEDVALARLLRDKQHKLALLDARAMARTRMYDGVGAIVDGFGKNARALYGARLVPLALLLVTTSVLPGVAVVCAAASAGVVDDIVAVAAFVVSIVVACGNRVLVGSRWFFGLLAPLSQAVVAGVFIKAAVVRRGRWRGRSFPT